MRIAIRTYYFTQWGQIITSLALFLSTWIVYKKKNKKTVSLVYLRASHILQEFGVVMQILIFIIYWSQIHFKIQDYINQGGLTRRIYFITVHIIPNAWIVIDFIISKYQMHWNDVIYFVALSIVYAINNLIQTKCFERLPYPFLQWNSFDCIYVVFALTGVFILSYWIIYKASHLL